MNPELQSKLYEKYPTFFKEKDLPMTQTCMCWGIDCGDGWYSLIESVAKKAESYNKTHNLESHVVATQVKEKFGSLRIYTSPCIEEVDKLIRSAEKKSSRTCEKCGDKGKAKTSNGWISTLCEKCNEEREKRSTV